EPAGAVAQNRRLWDESETCHLLAASGPIGRSPIYAPTSRRNRQLLRCDAGRAQPLPRVTTSGLARQLARHDPCQEKRADVAREAVGGRGVLHTPADYQPLCSARRT